MNAHEEIKLNDFKAHKGQILSEIDIASKRLSGILTEIKTAEGRYDSVLKDIASASSELGAIVLATEEEVNKAETRIADADRREATLRKDIADFEQYREDERALLSRERNSVDQELLKKREEIKYLNEQIPVALIELDNIHTAIAEDEEQYESMQNDMRIWKEVSTQERADAAAELESIRKDRIAEEKALAKAKAAVAEEIAKISLPQKSLSEDYAKLARMKINIDVYAKRVKRAYKTLYPDRQFII